LELNEKENVFVILCAFVPLWRSFPGHKGTKAQRFTKCDG